MKRNLYLLVLACSLINLPIHSADMNNLPTRMDQLKAKVQSAYDSSYVYKGQQMSLPIGYTTEEWQQLEKNYINEIAHTKGLFDRLRLYEQLAIAQTAQKNYDAALESLKEVESQKEELLSWDETNRVHRLYLHIADVEKLRGNKREVANALFNSVCLSDYYYFLRGQDYETIMQDINRQWLPKDKTFMRTFYEYYIVTFNSDCNYSTLKLFAKKLKKIYTPADSLQLRCVDMQLCLYDTTLSPNTRIQKSKEYNRTFARHKDFTFGGQQFYGDHIGEIFKGCFNWKYSDETYKNNVDTIEYEFWVNLAYSKLLSETMHLDSLREQEGCRSVSYRSALSKFFSQYSADIVSGEAALAYLEQVNQWDLITKEDVQWIDDSLQICQPLDTSYIGNVGEWIYDYDRDEVRDYVFFCHYPNEYHQYYQRYLPIVARAYGKKSNRYYLELLREARLILEGTPNYHNHPDIDSLHWDEAIMNAKQMKPIRVDIVSDNLDIVLNEWNDTVNDPHQLAFYTDILYMGYWTYNEKIIENMLSKLQTLSQSETMTERTTATIRLLMNQAKMYLAILRKDLPLFHESAKGLAQDELEAWYVSDALAVYIYTYQ